MNKAELRHAMKQKRLALSPAQQAEAAQQFMQKALKFLTTQPYQTIAGYVAMSNELDVMPLLQSIKTLYGKNILVPRINAPYQALSFHEFELNGLELGNFGILQPSAQNALFIPDIVLVPLLAFDKHNHRLGYGGGYYDRTFAEITPRPILIGCAYQFQHVDTLPSEPHDIALNAIITV